MIDLSWNTNGRTGLAEYNKARWRHFAFCLIPVALFVAGSIGVASVSPWIGGAIYAAGAVLLAYYRYRFSQVMVKRLHDRNMSGTVLLLSPIILAAIIGIGGTLAISAAMGDGIPHWLLDNNDTWIWFLILPSIGFNVFLRVQLSQAGTPGINRYGAPPDKASAAAVF